MCVGQTVEGFFLRLGVTKLKIIHTKRISALMVDADGCEMQLCDYFGEESNIKWKRW
jgi:hypothetical protein